MASAALLLALGAGCGGDASGPDAADLTVTLTTSRQTAAPGEAILVTVRAEPIGNATVRWITLSTSGLVEMRDSIATNGPGPQELSRSITLPSRPLTGQLTISGSASDGTATVSDQETVDVLDGVAPSIVLFQAEPLPAQPGDSTHFNFDVTDAVGISQVRLRVQSAFSSERILTVTPSTPRVAGILKVLVPNDVPIGSNATATLTVSDESGNVRESSLGYTIRDTRPPSTRVVFGGLHDDSTIRPGETAQITVEGTDNHQLAWIGYEGGGRRDSVAVTGSTAARTFPVLVRSEWMQRRPAFAAWARDVSGNAASAGEILNVYEWTEHPKVIVPFPNEPTPDDVVWDAKRSVVYLLRSDLDRGLNSSIDIIQVSSGAVVGTVAVPARVSGLSLTPSGDSLVTTLPEASALGLVDLTAQQRSLTVLPLTYVDPDRRPGTARVSGAHVFVPLIHGLYTGRLLDVNLATGAQTIRADIGGTADLTQYPFLLPLSSSRLVLHRKTEGYSNNDTFLFAASSNTFTPIASLPAIGDLSLFAWSPSGRMMFGNKVFDANFVELDSLAAQDWAAFASALSLDGETAYLATWFGYQKVRMSDGFILEQVKLGTQPMRFLLLPSGNTLIVVGGLPGTNSGEWAVIVVDIR